MMKRSEDSLRRANIFHSIDIKATKMPQRFKDSLIQALQYIENTSPVGIQQVIRFSSLARSEITCHSDIDLCIVFADPFDLQSPECALFKSKLRRSANIDIDVVCCHDRTFRTSVERLFQHIRDEGILLLETEP